LARTIYAGSDIFLIPSKYEPCGLTQMYALKYGTIPVVRATGGLDDSIQEYDPEKNTGNGFKFDDFTAEATMEALHRAKSIYDDKGKWTALIGNAMASDFSWERAARVYLELFASLLA
jgi:starch synthase